MEHGSETDGHGRVAGDRGAAAGADRAAHGLEHGRARGRIRLFAGLEPETRFYFVHSYAARRWELVVTAPFPAPVVTWSEHGGDRFVAAVENGPLLATQFHPEKSGDAGAEVLRRWVSVL